MDETRDFHLGVILTVTTDRFCSPSGMDGIYELLNWMTGDNLATHQLPRAGDECQPELLRQHPQLADVEPPVFSGELAGRAWLARQVEAFGATLPVAPMAAADHTRIDPLAEVGMNYPKAKVIDIRL